MASSQSQRRECKRESDLLKLVHPGGLVELHTKPVSASDVMSRNPRHFVTRPDIFRFPWIVVSPHSILTPGNVFFIVPCRTIRNLLKKYNCASSSTFTNNNSMIHSCVSQEAPSRGLLLHRCDHHHHLPDSELKPCIKKETHNTATRSRNLKVRFHQDHLHLPPNQARSEQEEFLRDFRFHLSLDKSRRKFKGLVANHREDRRM
ncbi:hypothetical protein PIB30_051150 [Stylosanthes scabra]|uniref:Uncharacterized protein n=1 Tax=Stylosanthes scabra TaxID=79078 RepID=A0ABU6QIH5_9FABA|nr:hypothetical protein [Stylosanthes scabra]